MPLLPDIWWTYNQAKTAILEQFGNADTIITLKTKFLTIEIEQDETLNSFGDRFYHQAQVLIESKAIANYDTKNAMIHAVKSHS